MALTRAQKLVVASTTLDMILEGVFITLPSISAAWPFVGQWAVPLILMTVPVGTLIGNLVLGRLADVLGRKPMYLAMLAVYAAGAALVLASRGVYELVAGNLVANAAIGGETPLVLSYVAETAPEGLRERLVVLVTNAGNAGAALAAAIAAAGGTLSVGAERLALGALIAAAIGVLAFTRSMVPESALWASLPREQRGRLEASSRPVALRLAVLAGMAVSSVLTFGLLALDIGPALYPRLTNELLLAYFAGEVAGGLVAAALVTRLGSRAFALWSFAGGLATTLAAVPVVAYGLGTPAFLAVLAANAVFTETVWASRNVLEAALFPTSARATGIALVRALPYAIWAAILVPEMSFSAPEYLAFAASMWALGVAASGAWYLKGVEVVGSRLPMVPEDLLEGRVREQARRR